MDDTPSGRMPRIAAAGLRISSAVLSFLKRQRSSLSFQVISLMTLLALIPVLLITLGSYFQTRSFIQDQTYHQLESIVQSQSDQLLAIANENQAYISALLKQERVTAILDSSLDSTSTADIHLNQALLSAYLQNVQGLSPVNIDAILLIDSQRRIKMASKYEWIGLDLSGERSIQQISEKTNTVLTLSPASLYLNQWVTFSSQPLSHQQGQATLIIATFPRASKTILETTSSMFDQGNAFYITLDDAPIGINPQTRQISQLPTSSFHTESLKAIFSSTARQGAGQIENPDLTQVFAFARWLPEINIGFVVEVPVHVVFRQIQAQIPYTLLLFVISLGAILLLVAWGSRAIVRPIERLTISARSFAAGDWSARSIIHRSDEIGVLANTFNYMVDQLSELYRSLEQKVEDRARQLRTAFEVGQMATASTNREVMIQQAVRLIIDRFGYSYAGIFLVDPSGGSATLSASYRQSGSDSNQKSLRISLDADTLIGWVARNFRSRAVTDNSLHDLPPSPLYGSGARAEAALPIAVNNLLLGILTVQSIHSNSFDAENLDVLQTIANQIATGLQNLKLLETTQINLDEMSLLFNASRRLSLTNNETEMIAIWVESLSQTPYVSGIITVADTYLEVVAITDPQDPQTTAGAQGITLPLQNKGLLANINQPIMINDLVQTAENDAVLGFFARRGCKSAVVFPLAGENRLEKIFVLGSRDDHPISAMALQSYSSLIDMIRIARQRFEILTNLEQRVGLLHNLNEINQAISAVSDLETIFKTLHQQVMRSFGNDVSFMIALFDSAAKQIQIPYVNEGDQLLSIPPYAYGEGLISHVIQTRAPLMLVKDTHERASELNAKTMGKPARSWLGVPLLLGDEAIGALVLQDALHEGRFQQTDLALFSALAPQIAVSIRKVQLLSDMQQTLAAFKKERDLLSALMENIPDEVAFKDAGGRYVRVSRSFAKHISPMPVETSIGKTCADLFPLEEAARHERALQEVSASGQALLDHIEMVSDASGAVRWQSISVIPLNDEADRHTGYLEIERDVTSLKNTEELANSRAMQLQIAAEIARDISGTLDTAQLLAKAVNLVRDGFGFYHASIFLIDAGGEFVALRESTGPVGEQMKQRGHRLAVGSSSIVGQAAGRRTPWVVNDIRQEPLYYANPLLPDTRAECSIPLLVGEQLLGVLDVQSTQANHFSPEDLQILTIMADQLAIAIWNSILFGQSQTNLAQHRLLHQIAISASAANSLDDALHATVQSLTAEMPDLQIMVMLLNENGLQVRMAAGYEGFDISQVHLSLGEGAAGRAAQMRCPVRVNDLRSLSEMYRIDPAILSELAVPILFRETLVGVLVLSSRQLNTFNENDEEIMASLGNTLGAIFANAQLIQEVRQQVERQQKLFDITARIRHSSNIEAILQTSAREIALSLGAKRASIEITTGENAKTTSPGNGRRAPLEVKP